MKIQKHFPKIVPPIVCVILAWKCVRKGGLISGIFHFPTLKKCAKSPNLEITILNYSLVKVFSHIFLMMEPK